MSAEFPSLHPSRFALLRITEPARVALERLVFRRYPGREWGSFFRFGYRRTRWGLAVSFVDLLPPRPGDLDRNSPIVSFHPDYISRMLDELEATRLGIGVVHSHPQGGGVGHSGSDDNMDLYYSRLFRPYGTPRPFASVIVSRRADGNLFFGGRACDGEEWMSIDTLFTAGRRLDAIRSRLLPPIELPNEDASAAITARWDALTGRPVSRRLHRAVVGVVGCSGTGSPVVEILARAQVGEFVLVDEQRGALSNLERMHGSRFADLRNSPPYKVELMARLIREVNPSAKVKMLVGNVLDDRVIDELLRCDIVLGCTDTLHGRAALGDLAALYLIPVIDVGVRAHGRSGKVTAQLVDITRLGPGDPCPFCLDRIDANALSAELMSEEERQDRREAAAAAIRRGEDGTAYWGGDAPQLPTVGYLTTVAGSLAAGYALNWLLGTAEMPQQALSIRYRRARVCIRRRYKCAPRDLLVRVVSRARRYWRSQRHNAEPLHRSGRASRIKRSEEWLGCPECSKQAPLVCTMAAALAQLARFGAAGECGVIAIPIANRAGAKRFLSHELEFRNP